MEIDIKSITKLFELVIKHGMEFLGYLGLGTATAYALIKYFSQKIFDKYLQERFEKYKSKLERENTKHRIQFENLQKERAEFIKKLYKLIYNYKNSVFSFFNEELEDGQENIHLQKLLNEWENYMVRFNNKFNKNRILLDENLCSNLESFENNLSEIYQKTRKQFENNSNDYTTPTKNQNFHFPVLRQEVNELFDNKLSQIQKDLEANFRAILGVV